jgi:hypothetical protein
MNVLYHSENKILTIPYHIMFCYDYTMNMEGPQEYIMEEVDPNAELERMLENGVKRQNWWAKPRLLLSAMAASVLISGCNESDKITPPSDDVKVEHAETPVKKEEKKLRPTEQIVKIIGTIDPESLYVFEDSPVKKDSQENGHTYVFSDSEKEALGDLKEAAKKHKLNYITDSMSQNQIDNLYNRTILEMDDTYKRREHLSTLNFNPAGDWRLQPYVEVMEKMLGEKSDEQISLDSSVTIKSINEDIEEGSTKGAETDEFGKIKLSSKTIIEIIEPSNSIEHTTAVGTWLHELTHRYKTKRFKAVPGGIDEVYSTAFSNGVKPEGYLDNCVLSSELNSILNEWLDGPLYRLNPKHWPAESKMYPLIGTRRYQEHEAMTASILGLKRIKEQGLHFKRPVLVSPTLNKKSIKPKSKH